MERFLVIYSLLRKIQLFPVSTLENVRRYQLESLPRGRRNCAREYISSMKIGKRRKDCMRFENSGRTIFIPSIRKIERSNFYSQQFFLQLGRIFPGIETDRNAQKLIYFRKLFILHSQQFFIYIYIFSSSCFSSLAEDCLQKQRTFFLQFFLHWEEYSQECLETDLFS